MISKILTPSLQDRHPILQLAFTNLSITEHHNIMQYCLQHESLSAVIHVQTESQPSYGVITSPLKTYTYKFAQYFTAESITWHTPACCFSFLLFSQSPSLLHPRDFQQKG